MGSFQTPTQGSGNKSKEVPSRHKNYADDNLKKKKNHMNSFLFPSRILCLHAQKRWQDNHRRVNSGHLGVVVFSFLCLSKCTKLSPALGYYFHNQGEKKCDFFKSQIIQNSRKECFPRRPRDSPMIINPSLGLLFWHLVLFSP